MTSFGNLGVALVVLSLLSLTQWYIGILGILLVVISSILEFEVFRDIAISALSLFSDSVLDEQEEEE